MAGFFLDSSQEYRRGFFAIDEQQDACLRKLADEISVFLRDSDSEGL
jgi:hypothetical protein